MFNSFSNPIQREITINVAPTCRSSQSELAFILLYLKIAMTSELINNACKILNLLIALRQLFIHTSIYALELGYSFTCMIQWDSQD